jgi:hypothetical protein
LTYTELDTNFDNLQDATIGFTVGATNADIDLNSRLTVAAGTGISLTLVGSTLTVTNTSTSPDLSNYVTLDGVQTITGAKTLTGTTTLGPYKESVYSLGSSGSGTVTPDFLNGPVQTLAATGNFTLALPSNMTAGSNLTLIITQDATGSRTMTANAAYRFAGGLEQLSTVAGSIDVMTIFYDGSRYLSSLIRNYV